MVTVGACTTLTVVVASGVVGSVEVEGTAAAGVVAVAVVVVDEVLGAVAADAVSRDAAPLAVCVAAAEAASAAARSAFVTCGRNGSLVWKTSNETSWPPSAAAGGTSVSASSPAGVAPVPAVVPSTPGNALVPAGAAAEGGGTTGFWFISFNIL